MPASRNTQIAGLVTICWAIWKLRNRACFDHKLIKNPFELISYSTMFMKHWAGLHDEKDADDIRAGADGLLRLAGASAAPGRNLTTTVERRPLIDTDRDVENDMRMETDDLNDDAA
jgi:hypothetical protein